MFTCLGADWTPTIGDPTIFGWITVLAYLVCAILSVMVWNSRNERVLRRFWALMSLVLGFLALNKQLDLQSAMTATGRCLFRQLDIYEQRSFAQLVFVIVLAAVVFLLYLRGMRAMRRYRRSHGMAMLGLGFVALYVLIRATSFHAVDMLGSQQVMGISVNFLLENFGLVLIAINAIGLLRGRIRPEIANGAAPLQDGRSAPSPRGLVFTSSGVGQGAAAGEAPTADNPAKPKRGPRFPVEPLNR